jgi:predicted transcriptional regulator
MKAWNQAKDLDDSQKLRLIALLAESVKPAKADTMSMEQMLEGYPYKRHTKAELNAMLDEAEARFEAGLGIPHEEVMREMDEEFADMDKELYTPEEAYELTMKDIKAIYDDATV